jgi:prepilin peptidase CpaA
VTALNSIFALFYVFCVIYALISDYSRLVIPNWISIGLALAFTIFALAGGVPHVWTNLAVAAVVFLVFFAFFALGRVRAGDVKFIGALMLWAGLTHGSRLAMALLMVAIVFALALVFLRYALKFYPALGDFPGMHRFCQWARLGIYPFGLPIGVAALIVAPAIFSPA